MGMATGLTPIPDAVRVLDAAGAASASGREMLRRLATLYYTWGDAPAPGGREMLDARDPFSQKATEVLSGALAAATLALDREAAATAVEAAAAEADRAAQAETLRAARGHCAALLDGFRAAEAGFGDANRSLLLAARLLEERQNAEAHRAELRAALAALARLVADGGPERELEQLAPLLARLALEDSLCRAATAAALTPPHGRGPFDRAALGALEAALRRAADVADADADAHADKPPVPMPGAGAGAVGALAALRAARARQLRAAAELRSAEVAWHRAEAAERCCAAAELESEHALRRRAAANEAAEARCCEFRGALTGVKRPRVDPEGEHS